jgi:LCP family protein required for cell wall assembly
VSRYFDNDEDPDGGRRQGRRGARATARTPKRDGGRARSGPHGRSGLGSLFTKQRVAGGLAIVVATACVSFALVAYAQYRAVWDSIGKVKLIGLGNRPPKYNNALNILVFGTDDRAGLTNRQKLLWHVGHPGVSNNTDTVMIVHISPGRHRVTVVSIPRDTQFPVLACPSTGKNQPGQAATPGASESINQLFYIGGVSCLFKTVEQVTQIHLDHFVELKFKGFVNVINDIGGVYMCSPYPVTDSVSGLKLKKGWNRMYGAMALKFWRTRENIGLGSDLQRIQRDQLFMAALLQRVHHSGLLTNPGEMLRVLKDVGKSVVIDSGMTQNDLITIASSLRGLSTHSAHFVTAPNIPDPADPLAHVVLQQPVAGQLFSALAHDRTLPKLPKRTSTGKGAGGTALVKSVSPAKVNVKVLNGSGVTGQAALVAAALTKRGFHVTGQGNAANYTYTKSVIEYSGAADLPAADTLKAQLSNVTLVQNASLTKGTIELISGSKYVGLKSKKASGASSAAAQAALNNIAKTYGGINGNQNVCKATYAYQGPNGY